MSTSTGDQRIGSTMILLSRSTGNERNNKANVFHFFVVALLLRILLNMKLFNFTAHVTAKPRSG
jgi:hypothetical protein